MVCRLQECSYGAVEPEVEVWPLDVTATLSLQGTPQFCCGGAEHVHIQELAHIGNKRQKCFAYSGDKKAGFSEMAGAIGSALGLGNRQGMGWRTTLERNLLLIAAHSYHTTLHYTTLQVCTIFLCRRIFEVVGRLKLAKSARRGAFLRSST